METCLVSAYQARFDSVSVFFCTEWEGAEVAETARALKIIDELVRNKLRNFTKTTTTIQFNNGSQSAPAAIRYILLDAIGHRIIRRGFVSGSPFKQSHRRQRTPVAVEAWLKSFACCLSSNGPCQPPLLLAAAIEAKTSSVLPLDIFLIILVFPRLQEDKSCLFG